MPHERQRIGDNDGHGAPRGQDQAAIGHNRPGGPAQWQTPHLPNEPTSPSEAADPDRDLVVKAFVEGFLGASDPTSFLRLAKVPFEAVAVDGSKLVLLRVEIDAITDVGSITPHLGGESFRYDPLPGRMVLRRKRLSLVYFDGHSLRSLDLAAALDLQTL